MEDYFIERETIGKFVDELIKKKPLPVNTAEELNEFREKTIREIDDKIGTAIFATLSDEQLTSLKDLISKGEDTPEIYDKYFTEAGTDFEKVATETMQKYATEFLGGKNE